MKLEDLVIGGKYIITSLREGSLIVTLEALDLEGDPVLRADDNSKHSYATYSKLHEEMDPACKVGTYGHTMGYFLEAYNEYKG